MPDSTRKNLLRVLLWWVTVLSISQVVLLVLFLTMGHSGHESHNGAEQVSTSQTSEPRVPSSSSECGVSRMFTFTASKVHANGCIGWQSNTWECPPITQGNTGVFKIKKDGNFLMCLRVTLRRCSKCEEDGVDLVYQDESIVFGSISNITKSTGLLCKMKRLSAGHTLKVKLQNKLKNLSKEINYNGNVTYLDVFFMPSNKL